MFNQFENTTTKITMAKLPLVAMEVKKAMLSYKYATNCAWYGTLSGAKSVKEIFDLFNIKFELSGNDFVPVVKDFEPIPNIMEVLKAVAPHMEDGSLFVADEYNHYYTITFENGVVTGKKRTANEPPKMEAPKVESAKAENKKPEVQKSKSAKSSKKSKKENTFKMTKPQEIAATIKRDDNTYTVKELAAELLKQIEAGNGAKYVTIEADFLFSNEKYA